MNATVYLLFIMKYSDICQLMLTDYKRYHQNWVYQNPNLSILNR